jgi:hypothetical protein
MRRVAIVSLILCCSVAAWANSSQIVFNNSGGKITLNGSSLSLTGSTLTSFSGLGLNASGLLGSVSFSTASMAAGTINGGGMFASGGSFTIAGNGAGGLSSGVLFTGSFTGPVSWTVTFDPKGFGGKGAYLYTLTGNVSGTLWNGANANGAVVQFTFDVPKGQPFSKSVRLNYGSTVVTVPEPGTLGLLGTGLVGLAASLRRKFKA